MHHHQVCFLSPVIIECVCFSFSFFFFVRIRFGLVFAAAVWHKFRINHSIAIGCEADKSVLAAAPECRPIESSDDSRTFRFIFIAFHTRERELRFIVPMQNRLRINNSRPSTAREI